MKRELYFRMTYVEALFAGHRLAQNDDPKVRDIGERMLSQYREAQECYEIYLRGLSELKKSNKKVKKPSR